MSKEKYAIYIAILTASFGVTLFNIINYIFDILLTQIYSVMNLKSESFPFFMVSMVSLFFILFIPEIKGKTLEEIGEKWKSIK